MILAFFSKEVICPGLVGVVVFVTVTVGEVLAVTVAVGVFVAVGVTLALVSVNVFLSLVFHVPKPLVTSEGSNG